METRETRNVYAPIKTNPTGVANLDFSKPLIVEQLKQESYIDKIKKMYPFIQNVLLYSLLIILIIVIIIMMHTPSKTYVANLYHSQCAKHGPCGSTYCPMNDPTNPIKLILDQVNICSDIQISALDIQKSIDSQIALIPVHVLPFINEIVTKCVTTSTDATNNIAKCVLYVRKLASAASSSPIKFSTYIMQNQASSLTTFARIQYLITKNQLLSVQIYTAKNIIDQKVKENDPTITIDAQAKFIQSYNDFTNALTITAKLYDKISTMNVAANLIMNSVDLPPSTFDELMNNIVIINDNYNLIQENYFIIKRSHENIVNIYHLSKEPFGDRRLNTNIPNSIANNLLAVDDYHSALLSTAIEPSIVENHRIFAVERNKIDTGSGIMGIRDDPNDVIPWVGLQRPSYRRSDGTSAEFSTTPLKSIPSDNADKKMLERKPITLTFN